MKRSERYGSPGLLGMGVAHDQASEIILWGMILNAGVGHAVAAAAGVPSSDPVLAEG
ncbi:hypothetical protein DSM104299_05232 [Baekduia alba]|uniref:hypothetical protein n=1 Tax=Baekduia alba TaxID=2997333 RepID=UPI00233F84CC|nr:hypothetical protein [Baekduia alba]WCB96473.1 hypothetical protein DSM104299_05232 [Baekduia alba]